MAVGLDHPVVADYLRRLEEAARGLPAGRRSELVDEIRGHVTEALAATGDDEPGVRSVLDRVGSPEDIVAAERELLAAEPPGQLGATGPWPNWGPPAPEAVVPLSRPSSLWGPVEVIAVVGLTIGSFVVPIVGPIVGLVCAWASRQWTRREKIIATLLAALTPLVVVVAGAGLFAVRSATSTVEHGPVIVDEGPAVQAPPAPEVSP
ncbi:MAG: hypothetical protein WAL50_20795 [Kineosporiaceae bacterium]